MKDGALVGATRAVWPDGTDSLALERLQLVVAVGAAKAGMRRSSKVNQRWNIVTRQKSVGVVVEDEVQQANENHPKVYLVYI
jgi:hypothetical protein